MELAQARRARRRLEAFGEPTEVLELVDVPEPTGPAAGEVLVGVEYAPINMKALSRRRWACRSVTSAVTIDDDQDQL